MNPAIRVSIVSIIVNIFLTVFKLIAGIWGHSGAMISDAIHSLSDVLSTIVVIIGVKMANRQSDSCHQYGHERMECIAAMFLAAILAVIGFSIGYTGVSKALFSDSNEILIPTALPLIAALVSIAAKEWMYWFTRATAKKLSSGALMADAWHHRSDAMSSVGSFIGILGARSGYPILDPIASVVISVFIVKVAYSILRDSISKLTDHSCDEKTSNAIRALIMDHSGVLSLDLLKTRLFASKIYIDVEIGVLGNLSLQEAHEIAECLHDSIETSFPEVKHCMIHINPRTPPD